MADVRVKLYRFKHQDGRTKDWAIPATVQADDAELVVYFGATGKALRQAVTPAARCLQGDPAAEAAKRVREKLRKGYRYLGDYRLESRYRLALTPVSATESAALDATPVDTEVLLAAVDADDGGWFY